MAYQKLGAGFTNIRSDVRRLPGKPRRIYTGRKLIYSSPAFPGVINFSPPVTVHGMALTGAPSLTNIRGMLTRF